MSHDQRPNICPSKEHRSLDFTFGPGCPDGPKGPAFPARPGSPWKQHAITCSQLGRVYPRWWILFQLKTVYLVSFGSSKTAIAHVTGVTIRTLRGIKHTPWIGRKAIQYASIVKHRVRCRTLLPGSPLQPGAPIRPSLPWAEDNCITHRELHFKIIHALFVCRIEWVVIIGGTVSPKWTTTPAP